jgi:urease accessory protein
MDRDTKKMRAGRPFVMANVETSKGIAEIVRFILDKGMLEKKHDIETSLSKMIPAQHNFSEAGANFSTRSFQ